MNSKKKVKYQITYSKQQPSNSLPHSGIKSHRSKKIELLENHTQGFSQTLKQNLYQRPSYQKSISKNSQKGTLLKKPLQTRNTSIENIPKNTVCFALEGGKNSLENSYGAHSIIDDFSLEDNHDTLFSKIEKKVEGEYQNSTNNEAVKMKNCSEKLAKTKLSGKIKRQSQNVYFLSLKNQNQEKLNQKSSAKAEQQKLNQFKLQLQKKAFIEEGRRLTARRKSIEINKSCSVPSLSKQRKLNSGSKAKLVCQNSLTQQLTKKRKSSQKQAKNVFHNQGLKSPKKYKYLKQADQEQKGLINTSQDKPVDSENFLQQKKAFRSLSQTQNFFQEKPYSHFSFQRYHPTDDLSLTISNPLKSKTFQGTSDQLSILSLDKKINQLYCALFFSEKIQHRDERYQQTNAVRHQIVELSQEKVNTILSLLVAFQEENILRQILIEIFSNLLKKVKNCHSLLTKSIFAKLLTESILQNRINEDTQRKRLENDFSKIINFFNSAPHRKANFCDEENFRRVMSLNSNKNGNIEKTFITNQKNPNLVSDLKCNSNCFEKLSDLKVQISYENSPLRTKNQEKSLNSSNVVQKYQFENNSSGIVKETCLEFDYINEKLLDVQNIEGKVGLNQSQELVLPKKCGYNDFKPYSYIQRCKPTLQDYEKDTQRCKIRFMNQSKGRNDVFLKYIGRNSKNYESVHQIQRRVMEDSVIQKVYSKGRLKRENPQYNKLTSQNKQRTGLERAIYQAQSGLNTRANNERKNPTSPKDSNKQDKSKPDFNTQLKKQSSFENQNQERDFCRLKCLSSKVDQHLALYQDKIQRIQNQYKSLKY